MGEREREKEGGRRRGERGERESERARERERERERHTEKFGHLMMVLSFISCLQSGRKDLYSSCRRAFCSRHRHTQRRHHTVITHLLDLPLPTYISTSTKYTYYSGYTGRHACLCGASQLVCESERRLVYTQYNTKYTYVVVTLLHQHRDNGRYDSGVISATTGDKRCHSQGIQWRGW